MGKASRLRAQKQSAARMDRARQSAYAYLWKVMGAELESPAASPMGLGTARIWRDNLPHSRVYLFPEWSAPTLPLAELRSQLGEIRLPFPVTLLDAANYDLGDGWRLTGVLGLEQREALVFYCRKGAWEALSPSMFLSDIANWEGEATPVPSLLPTRVSAPTDLGERLGRAAVTMLAMLECANVEVRPALEPPQKGHIAHGIPHFDVYVRQRQTRRESPEEPRAVDWSHRWETAAHFKHFKRGPIFNSAPPEKRLTHPVHGECVRIWCPSFIKGPADKPLIPKVRIVGR